MSNVQYAKKRPGRLASRLLKMRREGAQGSVGADPKKIGLTPPAAHHYFITVMMPRLGTSLNLRTQRELPTLCVALDFFGLSKASSSGRLDHPTCEGVGEVHRGRSLGLSPIFGASQSRRSRTPGEGRGVLHLPGISERLQIEGVQPMMERPPKRRGQGRSRKRRAQGQGERERKRQRKREAESQRVEAGVDKMAEWQWSWEGRL